ncbi:MAG: histidine triad nucleotide-binding protein [Alphaproteobacteria bacterium CG_4_10_14_0_2_um_filter_63_37]|nr:MAG: histidine triad nucleotide-binding protein [Proteobacteria bacterium CG1_02_64_396]PJA24016.1 MAG: histidine triad nucleotide-binding protein [Alphaproteobacteria bacterium CG_4_10_14_0_2_um_filter_63_37]
MDHQDCIFCRIIAGTIPSEKVFEDDRLVVIKDIAPKAPVHLLVLPKAHHPTLNEAASDPVLLGAMLACAARMAREQGIAEKGYRTVVNVNQWGGQVVFHLHLHILGGKPLTF